MLFLSGATARNTEAEYGDMAAQTDVILKRIKFILEAEGGTLDNIVKITSFVTEISSEAGAATHQVRMKYFGDNLPASTRVQVAGLVEPHLKIEIEAPPARRHGRADRCDPKADKVHIGGRGWDPGQHR